MDRYPISVVCGKKKRLVPEDELARLLALESKVREFCKKVDPDDIIAGCADTYVNINECCHDCERCWLAHFGLEVNEDE